jgi:hypothetical protein
MRNVSKQLYPDDAPDPGGRKPAGAAESPVRAWFFPRHHGIAPEFRPAEEDPDQWTMSVEDRANPRIEADTFAELVRIAREEYHAVEYYVWSRSRCDYEQFTAETVIPIE